MKKLLLFLMLCPLIASAQLTLPYSIKINNAKPLDYYYYESDGTPYDSEAEVISAIPAAVRYAGLKVNILGVDYVFTGTGDEDLEVYLGFSNLSNLPTTLSGYGITDALSDSTNFWRTKSDFTIPSSRTITIADGKDLVFKPTDSESNYLSFKSDGITLGGANFGIFLDYVNVGVNFNGNSTGGVFIRAGTSAQASLSLFSQIASITAASTIKFGPNSGALFSMNTASTEGITTISHKANANSNIIINPSGSTESEIQVVNTNTGESTSIKPGEITVGSVDADEIGYLDGVTSAIQTQIDTKLKAASTASTGTDVAFDIPRTYGYAADATGNITFTATGLVEGMTQLMIHNDSSEPTFETGMVVISGTYQTGVDNYIMFMAIKSNLILVTISQEQ